MNNELPDDNLELSDDAFDLAFEAAAEPSDTPIEEPTAELPEQEEEVVEVQAETPVEEAPVEEEPEVIEPVVAKAPEPAPKPQPKEAPAAPKEPEIDPAIEEAARKAIEDAQAAERLTEEEAELLNQSKEDFPGLVKVIEAIQRTTAAKMENMYAAKMKEMESKLSTQMEPALQSVQVQAANAHQAAILGVHPDAPTLIEPIEKWVAEKPAFLQASYNAVLDRGTSQDVIELFNLYKAETGSAQTPEPVVAKVDVEKEKRLKAQEGVKGRNPGGRAAAVDPDDFEGAFDKFAATA